MILERSTTYWATGITLRWANDVYRDESGERTISAWGGAIEFFDDGFADDDLDNGLVSTQGGLHTRYLVRDGESVTALHAVIDALRADAARLGIEMKSSPESPYLYYKGDGEDDECPPPAGWREMLAAEAARIGWATPYKATTAGGSGR